MDVIDWLLDSDPAIRWQVLRDLTGAPEDQVAAERVRVADEGWGHRLLALQGPDGKWPGGVPAFSSEKADGRGGRGRWSAAGHIRRPATGAVVGHGQTRKPRGSTSSRSRHHRSQIPRVFRYPSKPLQGTIEPSIFNLRQD